MKKSYQGSCHCGAVRYQADIDLSQGTMRCNCSICSKSRNWLAMVKADDFRLLAGEDVLSDYQFGRKVIHHQFCRQCGIHPFGWGIIPEMGGKLYAVNVATLDSLEPAELAGLKVRYVDGREDNFQAAPAETRHL